MRDTPSTDDALVTVWHGSFVTGVCRALAKGHGVSAVKLATERFLGQGGAR